MNLSESLSLFLSLSINTLKRMPSWIALITTTLVSFHTRILILPLLLLAGLLPPLHPLLQRNASSSLSSSRGILTNNYECTVLIIPFAWTGWIIKHLGIVLKALLLVQGFTFDKLGDGINGYVSLTRGSHRNLIKA